MIFLAQKHHHPGFRKYYMMEDFSIKQVQSPWVGLCYYMRGNFHKQSRETIRPKFRLPPEGVLTETGKTDPLRYYYKPLIGRLYIKRIEILLALLPKKKFCSALEIGYGSGILIPTIQQYVTAYYGIDLDANPDQVYENIRKSGIEMPIHLVQGDIFELECKSFDLIIAISVFEHIKEIEKLIRKIRTLLSNDGYLLIGVPRTDRWMSMLFSLIGFNQIDDYHVTDYRAIINQANACFDLIAEVSMPQILPRPCALYHGALLRPRFD